MSIKNMTKDELELLSNKDITNLLLEEKGKQTTPDLFKKYTSENELAEADIEDVEKFVETTSITELITEIGETQYSFAVEMIYAPIEAETEEGEE